MIEPGQNTANIIRILRYGFISALLLLAALAPGSAQARYAAYVIDFETGRVLHSVNANTRNYPASLTKMMTLYLAFEALDKGRLTMEQLLPVSARAAAARPSKLGLRRGSKILVRQAILAVVTKSANDAAVVIAEALGGSERLFGRIMTRKARELGMNRTSFRNASGLPNRRQLSTARDMATLAKRLMIDYPQRYHFFSTHYFEYEGRRFRNHNTLLVNYPGTDGMKTGYTRASGYNLVVSAKRKGRRIIGVIFGGKSARSRDRGMRRLLNKSFAKLKLKTNSTKPIAKAPATQTPKTAKESKNVSAVESSAPPLRKPATVEGSAAMSDAPKNLVWAIQVGAFLDRAPARQAAKQAVRRLPKIRDMAQVAIVPKEIATGTIYRARLIGLSKSKATEACRRLKSHKLRCVPVPPRADAKSAPANPSP